MIRYVVCGDSLAEAEESAEFLGLADGQWRWCSMCAEATRVVEK